MAVYGGPEITTDGLVLCLDAGNTGSYPGSGTAWRDLSGRNNTGTLVNGPVYVSGSGGGISFDGTNDYVSFSASSDFYMNTNQAYTLEVWVYHAAISTTTPPAHGYIDRTLTDEFNLYMSPVGASDIQFVSERRASGVYSQAQFTSARANYENKWTHVCGTYDGTTIRVYVDTVIGATTGTSTNSLTGSGLLEIGRVASTYGPMKGTMALARIYNRALSQAEIVQNYAATRGRFGL